MNAAQFLAFTGRPLRPGVTTETVNLLLPGQLYGERVNNVDLRVAKIVRVKGTRANIGLDFYNLTNANTPTTVESTYDPATAGERWQRPTAVLQPRFMRINVQFDFFRSNGRHARDLPGLRSGRPRARSRRAGRAVWVHRRRSRFAVLMSVVAALVQAGFAQQPAGPPASRTPAVRSPEVHPDRRVTFRLQAPKATEVTVSGEFEVGRPGTQDDEGRAGNLERHRRPV